jgi:hypothetical protein
MTFWGPQAVENHSIPYALFNCSEKLTKIADYSDKNKTTLFATIDRQNISLRKSALRSIKPTQKKPVKKVMRFQEVKPKPREFSIKVKQNWKLMDTLQFSRMQGLFFDAKQPEDLAIYGRLSYYDKANDKISPKTEKQLKQNTKHVWDPTASSDHILLSYAEDSTAQTVVCTDTVISALLCCTKSIYSWDMIITKKNNLLVFDKRSGGPLGKFLHYFNAAFSYHRYTLVNSTTVCLKPVMMLLVTTCIH